MLELLVYSTLACQDANAIILRIKKHQTLDAEWKLELVETVKDYVPECQYYWDAHD